MNDQLSVARLQVARERPYYSTILWAFQPVAVKDFAKKALGPIGVDAGLRLYYDPEGIAQFKPEELAGVLVHEIGHVIRAHSKRVQGRDDLVVSSTGAIGSLWNMAGDMEINDDLRDEKVNIGANALYPDSPPYKFPCGLMAEEYYEMLQNEMKDKPKVAMACTGGNCGSIANGKGQEHEEGGEGSDKVPAGVSEAEKELLRQKVAEDVSAHAKTRGTVPAWLERWAKERLKSKVDWRRLLAALIRRATGNVKGAVDYTYSKPGRRSGALRDFVWPSLQQPVPRISIIVDTSGSMSEKELAQALAEIEGVLTSTGQRQGVTVMAVDAAVHTTQKVFKATDVKLMGGGGTDMSLGLYAAEKVRPKPHVIILVTDGETPYPERPLSVPVIVALTGRSAEGAVPGWAKKVIVEPDAKSDDD